MGSWRKLLQEMASHPKPVNYTYADATRVLENLGFALAHGDGGSHRTWSLVRSGQPPLIVGLVDAGHGTLKSVYIRKMIGTLREAGLLPDEVD